MQRNSVVCPVVSVLLCAVHCGLCSGAERGGRSWDKSLNGVWAVESFEWNGIQRDVKNGKFMFLDGVICTAFPENGKVSMSGYWATADGGSTPHEIVLIDYWTKQRFLGIYQRRGDVLVLCYGKKRPTQFATAPSRFLTEPSGTPRLWTLRRVDGDLEDDKPALKSRE